MRAPVTKSFRVGPEVAPGQFIAEHLFFYLVTGTMNGDYGNKNYTLKAGEYGIVRKNRLGRQSNQKENDKVEKVVIVFDEPFLKAFQEKQKVVVTKFKSTESFLQIANNKLIPNFIHSLILYYNGQGKIDNAFVDVKREELLLILLQTQPELSGVFFDYGIPSKINLEEFMNRNYKFNVSMERFAYLTGRSLSSFKRDFKQIFNDTPGNWLIKMRLQEAYFLIDKKSKMPTDIFVDLGFEDLSHFSYAFKKMYGQNPTDLTRKKKTSS